MALSHKNRRWVVGGLLVGTLGGGPLVLSLIDFGGSAGAKVVQQIPKVEPAATEAIGSAGRLGAAGIAGLDPIQEAMTKLNATTVPATIVNPADPDS